jgi:hypothetical protein
MTNDQSKEITMRFNILYFIFICVLYTIDFVFSPEVKEKAPYDYFMELYPLIAIPLAVIILLSVFIVSAVFLKHIWNNFVNDIIRCRIISLQEAIAIVLTLSIFSL